MEILSFGSLIIDNVKCKIYCKTIRETISLRN